MKRLKRTWLSGRKSAAVSDIAARPRRTALGLELLEGRAMPAVVISGLDAATGAVTFTGDGSNDSLTLIRWETAPGSGTFVLRHNLTGGGLNSEIDLDAGTAGDQTLTLGSGSARNININLGDGTDALTIDDSWAFDHKVTFVGGAGTDTLVGNNNGNTWAITDVTTHAGTLGTGADNLSWSGTETLTGGVGTADDTLTGENAASTWNLDSAQTYTDGTGTITFTEMDVLQGGTGADTFNVLVDTALTSVKGGVGDDVFAFHLNGGNQVVLGGIIDGEGGSDTLTFSNYAGSDNMIATLTGVGADGFAGTELSVTSFTNIDALTGTGGTDVLTGLNAAATWAVDGSDEYISGGETLVLSAIEIYAGGSDADTFDVTGNHTGNLTGGSGADTFNFSAGTLTGDVAGDDGADDFNFTGGVITGTVTGEAGNDTFDLSGTVSVSGTLDGGADDDTFTLADTSTAGRVVGGTGTDTLSYAGRTGAAAVFLTASSADGYNGAASALSSGFATIDALVGSSNVDTLTGMHVNSIWTLDSTLSYSNGARSVTFSSFESLTGASANDTFMVMNNTAFVGTVKGGVGTNTVDYSDDSNTSAIDVSITGTNAGTVSGAFGFAAIANIKGGSGNDTFSFTANGARVTGMIDGQEGSNTLSYAGYTTGVRVSLAANSATGTGSITNFVNVTGGSGNDILIGNAVANVLTGGAGNDIITGGEGDDTINGGAGNDILIGGLGADTMDGGADDDILIGGSTIYDSSLPALNGLMAEWGRTSVPYATRVGRLTGTMTGGLNGSLRLTDTQVNADGAADVITGGAGTDWFFSTGDTVTDLHTGGTETQTNVS